MADINAGAANGLKWVILGLPPKCPKADHAGIPTLPILLLLPIALALGACNDKATLDRSQVETVRVEGRLFEVRIAPTEVANEYRMLVVRATLVINPDPEAERARASNVARQFMDRTCKGQPYRTLQDNLVDEVNLETRFRCL